ncbi:MAG: hypothetical protein WCA38_20090, partial [Candidatus Acidiferrales bacterium]
MPTDGQCWISMTEQEPSKRLEELIRERARLDGELERCKELARKIHDFRNTKGLAMVQIRYLGRFETKNEAFACQNITQQTV